MTRILAMTALVGLLVGCNPVYCTDTCSFAGDGECDDGRLGAATGLCTRGTDCTDCSPNPSARPPVPRPNGMGGTPDIWAGFGQPANPGANPNAYQTEDEWAYDNCPVGTYCCAPPAECWYRVFRLGTDSDRQGCASTVPLLCGEHRECIQEVPGDNSLEGRRGIGCAVPGASGERVLICEEPPGREPGLDYACCANGLDLEWCLDMPSMYYFGRTGGPDVRAFYRVGSAEHTCTDRSDTVPPPCNVSDEYPRGLEDMCRAAGADGLASSPEVCNGGPLPDGGTGISPACQEEIDNLLRSLPTTTNSCINACLETYRRCEATNNCVSPDCQNASIDCLTGCPLT